MTNLPRSDDLGSIPPLTPEQRTNLRANLTRLARDAEDAALLIDALEDKRGMCDCDYWHNKHRWHCATNYPAEGGDS